MDYTWYMARRRFFVDQVRKGQAEITGENAHHLTRVLRVEAGQKFEITDSERAWLASVETARKDLVRFSVIEEIAAGPELPAITLYLALIKFERFEWAVEKATELGVTCIVPVEANRSEQGLSEGAHKRVERWRRIAREASEQSRRLRAPDISDTIRFTGALSDASTHRVWLDERPGAKPLLSAIDLRPGQSAAIMIGPEGGWIDGERERLAASDWIAASLGPSILRAETAVCAALAALSQMWMVASTSPGTEPTGTIE
jgi:16S rRNA (uracil1498-N3)-methyltransferase